MTIPLEELETIGKQAFEYSFHDGQFFFPKVLYSIGGDISIAMYETDFNLFYIVCQQAALEGPLEFMAHTADTYWFDARTDVAAVEAILAGETSATQLFEMGHPGATEAMVIVAVDAGDNRFQRTMPYVRQGRTLKWGETVIETESLKPHLTGRFIETMSAAIKSSYAAADENARG